jgi:nickel transport protein
MEHPMRIQRLLLVSTLLGLGTVAASAHGIWTAERWGETGIVYGHGAEDGAYDPAKVKQVRAVDKNGKPVEAQTAGRKGGAVIEAADDAAVLLVDFANGIYSKGADGQWVNKPKREVPGATEAGDNWKHNLTIRHLHGEALPELPPQKLQIVPLVNPTELAAGALFKVRVLYDGKPLAGAAITPDYVNASEATLGKTDADGVAEVLIRNLGLNVIAVSHSVPLDDTRDADKANHFATLSFVNEPHHEH